MKPEKTYMIEMDNNELKVSSNSITSVLKEYRGKSEHVRIYQLCKGIINDHITYKVHFASYLLGTKINERIETIEL